VAAVAVSRDFQAAALSMAPLGWRLNGWGPEQLSQACRSPLRRHVGALDFKLLGATNLNCLLLVSEHMPHLR